MSRESPKGQRDFIEYYATEVMVQRDLNAEELFWIIEQSLKTPYYIASNLFASRDEDQFYYDNLSVEERAKLDRILSAKQINQLAIACNAVVDGLWLEGGALPEAFEPGEIVDIGLASISALIGVNLKEERTS